MGWLKDPTGENHPKVGFTYRIMRRFSRSLMSVWFRELDIVDNENIPPEGGLMFIAWHPSVIMVARGRWMKQLPYRMHRAEPSTHSYRSFTTDVDRALQRILTDSTHLSPR